MDTLSLKIINRDSDIIASAENEGFVNLVYKQVYQEGDCIVLGVSSPTVFLVIQLDDAMEPAYIYMKEKEYKLAVPFGEKHVSYNPKAFAGELHLLRARLATTEEIGLYKNLALNVYDSHGNTACFPHAAANVETRGESVFAARNAIDGNTENHSHGEWPYESWGINRDPNAEISLDFGRTVEIDKVVLYTRADFPHDNWWKQAELRFSDGGTQTLTMEKSDRPHVFATGTRRVSWIRLGKLIPDETDPSPFPALSQLEVFGTDMANGPENKQDEGHFI